MGTGYETHVKDVLRVVQALDGLLSDFDGAAQDAGRVMLPADGYGQVGSTAARYGTTAQQQLTMTLRAVATVLQKINERVKASAAGYADHDRRIADTLDNLPHSFVSTWRPPAPR